MSAELDDAAGRARRLYPRAKGLRTAYVNGAAAKLGGLSADACPYPLGREKTWRRAYRRAWLGGWESVEAPA